MNVTTITVGAQFHFNWIQTRNNLLQLLADQPEDVMFWSTSVFTRGLGQKFTADDPRILNQNLRIQVSGPNPWLPTDTHWHILLEPVHNLRTGEWSLVEVDPKKAAVLRSPEADHDHELYWEQVA